jgi:hypothetical protein
MASWFGLPAAVGALAIAVGLKKPQTVSPEVAANRAAIYRAALSCKDPAKLRRLAEAYAGEGYKAEGIMLYKRAALREASPEKKAMWREAMQKGLSSSDPAAVRNLASAFEASAHTGVAARLREYADGLDAAIQAAHEGKSIDHSAEEA